MSALPKATSWRPMTTADLDDVVAIERRAYAFPWTRGNFVDSLAAGYLAEVLLEPGDGPPFAYFVAMVGVGEMHLLNLTVLPVRQGLGHGSFLLARLQQHCRERHLQSLWLEVRSGNVRARQLYRRRSFAEVGVRRDYYPAAFGMREDAIVMSLAVAAGEDAVD